MLINHQFELKAQFFSSLTVKNHTLEKYFKIVHYGAVVCIDGKFRHYGNRWNIEVFFKTCKQFLKLLKESNSTSFDAFTCHLSIVAVRYMMLCVYERTNSDDRTIGELFYMFTAEVAEISFSNALNLIVAALVETVREYFNVSDEQIAKFTELTVFLSVLQHRPR